MARFTDRTGRPGPATWEVGDFPPGSAELPVTGVSWYEAAAYAEWAGKSLPTIFHWDRVALTWASRDIVPRANLSGDVDRCPSAARGAMNRFGVYDLAGNVREWCANESEPRRAASSSAAAGTTPTTPSTTSTRSPRSTARRPTGSGASVLRAGGANRHALQPT